MLVGGGHSHALLLRRFAMRPVPGARLTLVSPDSLSPYSGMLPGLVAGHYSVADSHIDLRRLCQRVGARFVRDRATGLDIRHRRIHLADGEPLDYDWLSLDIGATPDFGDVPGARQFATPVKPVAEFRQRWDGLLEQIRRQPSGAGIVTVGGGAGGVEMILAIEYRLRREGLKVPLQLITAGVLLPGYPETLRRKIRTHMDAREITVHEHAPVHEVREHELRFGNASALPFRFLLWCTGTRAASWLPDTELACTGDNFVRVDDNLRSIVSERVFAAGDCAWIEGTNLPRAGVYAVRQAKVLADNLQAAMLDQDLHPYRPQHRFLSLLSTGDQYAVGCRGKISFAGRWAWRWKDHIDRKFMRQFSELPSSMTTPDTSRPMHCAGCGAKVGPDALREALTGLHSARRPEIMADFSAGEDAAILRWPTDRLLLQSQDYFPAFIDEPYLFGRIAALHALSDLHAMNGQPHSALATISVAYNHPRQQARDLHQLMAGALRELNREHCTLLGGHSIEGPQTAAGFMVNGSAEPGSLLRKSGSRPGDKLLLSKPLGTGILLAGLMHDLSRGPWLDVALETMLISNADTSRLLSEYGATACTDITGFGLLGHLLEVLDAGGLGARLDLDAIAPLPGTISLLERGITSTLKPANDTALARCEINPAHKHHPLLGLLTDPQTSGGLLASLPPERADACLKALKAAGIPAMLIGDIVAETGTGHAIAVQRV